MPGGVPSARWESAMSRSDRWRHRMLVAALMAGSLLPQLGGCNPTLRTTVEDGVINLSTALLGSFLQAVIQLAQEQAAAGA